MLRTMLRSKIHRARITQCDPDYVGSITVDANLLKAADIRPNEAVHVLNLDNAVRFETYIIRGEAGSGIIGVNGAAARLVEVGQRVIIISYGIVQESLLDDHEATVLVVDDHNRITQRLRYNSLLEDVMPLSQE